MFLTVNLLIALSLGTHREQLEHLTGSYKVSMTRKTFHKLRTCVASTVLVSTVVSSFESHDSSTVYRILQNRFRKVVCRCECVEQENSRPQAAALRVVHSIHVTEV